MIMTNPKPRARDLGIPFDGRPGPLNAITDIDGISVGHTTLIQGHGRLIVGQGPVRTGVTAVLPRGKTFDPCFAAWYALNGNGEMTGTTWIEESGFLETPILITNTHSVGTVRDAAIAWQIENDYYSPLRDDLFWIMPVVAETYDGHLNDINGFHVKAEHVIAALDNAAAGPVLEGNVGGGTGMITHGFKGGIGSSSRLVTIGEAVYTVGVLVQSNFGSRPFFTIAGVPVGREIEELQPTSRPPAAGETGSIIVIVATDAPLLPHQLKRIAARVPAGLSKVGGHGSNSSGDIFLAFSTANPGAFSRSAHTSITMLSNDLLSPLFDAVIFAVEEAVINALVAAETMEGINGTTVYALPHDRVQSVLARYGRLRA
jgi:L-aminopeptidase/D-esterase-like protein